MPVLLGLQQLIQNCNRLLVIDEKKYRVVNFLVTLRKGLFRLSAAAGLESPTQFQPKHIMYKDDKGVVISLENILHDIQQQMGTS